MPLVALKDLFLLRIISISNIKLQLLDQVKWSCDIREGDTQHDNTQYNNTTLIVTKLSIMALTIMKLSITNICVMTQH